MKIKTVNVIIFAVAFILILFIASIFTGLKQAREAEDTNNTNEMSYKNTFIRSCRDNAGEASTNPGINDYCGCSFEELKKKVNNDWRRVGNLATSLSNEELTELVSPCFYHIM